MLPTTHLVAFVLLSYALIVIPGPNVLFVISRALQLGRAADLAAVVGGQLGVYTQVIAVAVGIGALVEQSAAIFTVIKLAGAAYLIYLGVQAIRQRRSRLYRTASGPSLPGPPAAGSPARPGGLSGSAAPAGS